MLKAPTVLSFQGTVGEQGVINWGISSTVWSDLFVVPGSFYDGSHQGKACRGLSLPCVWKPSKNSTEMSGENSKHVRFTEDGAPKRGL